MISLPDKQIFLFTCYMNVKKIDPVDFSAASEDVQNVALQELDKALISLEMKILKIKRARKSMEDEGSKETIPPPLSTTLPE